MDEKQELRLEVLKLMGQRDTAIANRVDDKEQAAVRSGNMT